ncbi:hypothetical protein SAMN05421853_1273 [Roseivivax halotolerans]|uniref:Uncharacterized protein n=1 Tax=Roseivivax halotolerans TaxID=93684 RepID=A0A1I6AN75_9RHOB|nr:hypothetical protein [Roseivivax halotolerans]SFQ70099.1 hypothetical protein SAMN05421853_1273 [Roseivivax halotolerans]
MAEYRLGSSPAVRTPGLVAWAINGYAFEDDRPTLLHIIKTAWPHLPDDAIHQLLSGAVPYTVEDETVIFSVED